MRFAVMLVRDCNRETALVPRNGEDEVGVDIVEMSCNARIDEVLLGRVRG